MLTPSQHSASLREVWVCKKGHQAQADNKVLELRKPSPRHVSDFTPATTHPIELSCSVRASMNISGDFSRVLQYAKVCCISRFLCK